jgi:hypothetical protein
VEKPDKDRKRKRNLEQRGKGNPTGSKSEDTAGNEHHSGTRGPNMSNLRTTPSGNLESIPGDDGLYIAQLQILADDYAGNEGEGTHDAGRPCVEDFLKTLRTLSDNFVVGVADWHFTECRGQLTAMEEGFHTGSLKQHRYHALRERYRAIAHGAWMAYMHTLGKMEEDFIRTHITLPRGREASHLSLSDGFSLRDEAYFHAQHFHTSDEALSVKVAVAASTPNTMNNFRQYFELLLEEFMTEIRATADPLASAKATEGEKSLSPREGDDGCVTVGGALKLIVHKS